MSYQMRCRAKILFIHDQHAAFVYNSATFLRYVKID